jgi:PKD repeat protein
MYRILVILVCFGCPLFGHAAVSISEVAWMGDTVSANYEWIELYNDGEAVVVDGWTLRDGMNLSVTLSGTIPASSYVTLERNRASGSYTTAVPFLIYTGALVNTGATLVLSNATGEVIDQVAGGKDWQDIGGDNVTKETAQYTSAGWRTGPGTPGRAPGALTTTPPPSPTSTTTPRAGSTSSGSSAKKSETVKFLPPPNNLRLSLDIQSVAYVNQLVPVRVIVTGVGTTTRNSLTYQWNFGDLSTSSAKEPVHVYRYPGTYVVTLQAAFGAQYEVVRHEITILPVQLTLARTDSGDVLLHNNAPYDVDVSGYRLRSQQEVVFPPLTIMSSKSTLTINQKSLGSYPLTTLTLLDRMRMPVATWPTYLPVTTPTSIPRLAPMVTDMNTDTPKITVSEVASLPVLEQQINEIQSVPLVLLPELVTSTPLAAFPTYVQKALLPVAISSQPSDTEPIWPYVALAVLLAAVLGSIVATSSSVGSRTDKISTNRSTIHTSV